MTYHVCYWETKQGKEGEQRTGACFSGINHPWDPKWELPEEIRYFAPSKLDKDQIDYFVRFVSVLFDTQDFSVEYATHSYTPYLEPEVKDEPGLMWKLKCKGWPYYKTLTHLTVFRYVQEFPAFVKLFHDARDSHTTRTETMKSFCDLHLNVKYMKSDNHALGEPRVTITQLKANLEKKLHSVHSYFTPHE